MSSILYDKGDIKGFPVAVVEKMLERQMESQGKKDIKVFEKSALADIYEHGFHWANTPEGYDFWENVIMLENWMLFFERYPDSRHSMSDLYAEITHLKFENLFN